MDFEGDDWAYNKDGSSGGVFGGSVGAAGFGDRSFVKERKFVRQIEPS